MNKKEKEKKQDLFSVKILDHEFAKFGNVFPELKVYQENKFCDYLNRGAKKIYTSVIKLPKMSEKEKNISGLKHNSDINGMIWISSDINPNGITGKNDIGRTYNIYLKFYGTVRYTKRKYEKGDFISFYDYGRTIEEIIEKFRKWVENIFIPFQKAIENKKYHWEKNNFKNNT